MLKILQIFYNVTDIGEMSVSWRC